MATEQTPTTRNELWRWCLRADAVAKCFVRDVMALREYNEDSGKTQDSIWWLGTVPCRSVQFVGFLVGAVAYERRTLYTVDDGTGALQCVHPRAPTDKDKPKSKKQAKSMPLPNTPDDIPKPCYDVGEIVRVTGRVERWHDTFQIFATDIERCRPNDEPEHWIATAELHKTHYTKPFVIPPLPPPPLPKTPVKQTPSASTPATPSMSSTTYTPSTVASASSPAHVEGPVRLRHPSRLHSKELISSTFKIYLKNFMDMLSDPPRTTPFSLSQSDDDASLSNVTESPTKYLKRVHQVDGTATPRLRDRSSRPWQDEEHTPRPLYHHRKENTTQHVRSRRSKGFTLSYLRRVPELSDMASRVVAAETKRRAREARRKQKEAARAGKPQQPLDVSNSRAEPASKKIKRLYTWAIRELYREGSITLHDDDAPVWEVSTAARDTRGVWKMRKTVDQSTDAADHVASYTSSKVISETLMEDDDLGELSDPPAYEESYIPLTTSLLTGPIIDIIRNMMMRKPNPKSGPVQQTGTNRRSGNRAVGPTAEELRDYMGKLDARWENVTEYAVADALQLLKAQDRVYKVGQGRWELTL